jgi:hypothetical protein
LMFAIPTSSTPNLKTNSLIFSFINFLLPLFINVNHITKVGLAKQARQI